MNHVNTHTSRTPAVGLTAAGVLMLALLAGTAMGQSGQNSKAGGTYEVVIEKPQTPTPAPAPARPSVRSQETVSQTIYEINQNVDGTSIHVRRVNNDPVVVKLNGNVLDAKHFEVKPGVVIITDPATGKQHVVSMPEFTANAPVALPQPVRDRNVGGAAGQPAEDLLVQRWAQATTQPRVMLGVVMGEPDSVVLEHLGLDAKKAILLESVIEGLPAHKAGLRAKDIVVGFGENAEPKSAEEVRKLLAQADPGQKVKVRVIRRGEPVTVELVFEAFDSAALGRATRAAGPTEPNLFGQRFLQDQAAWEQNAGASRRNAEEQLRRAADMLAQLQQQGGANITDAHRQAVDAINKAIEAMRQGEAFGFEIQDMRRLQQEAIERLRQELAQGGQNNRLWANPGEPGQGFALTIPSPPSTSGDARWDERLASLEKRLVDLENKIERSMQRFERQSEAMLERLMHRVERALQDREGSGR